MAGHVQGSALACQGVIAQPFDYLNRLARALLDDSYQDDDSWILEARALFALARDRLDHNHTSWEIGVQLAHSLGQKKIAFNPRTDLLTAPYRDDNRYFW